MILFVTLLGWFIAFVLALLVLFVYNELRIVRERKQHYEALYRENHQQRNFARELVLKANGDTLRAVERFKAMGGPANVANRLFGDRETV